MSEWLSAISIRISFSYIYLHDVTNSNIEIPEVRVWLPEWEVILPLHVWQYYRCGKTVAHATFSPNTGWTVGFQRRNTNKETEHLASSTKVLRSFSKPEDNQTLKLWHLPSKTRLQSVSNVCKCVNDRLHMTTQSSGYGHKSLTLDLWVQEGQRTKRQLFYHCH